MGILVKIIFIFSLILQTNYCWSGVGSCTQDDDAIINEALSYEVKNNYRANSNDIVIMYDGIVKPPKKFFSRGNSFLKFSNEAIESLFLRSSESGIRTFISSNKQVVFVGHDSIDQLFDGYKSTPELLWERFYVVFPDAIGMINASVPGYDKRRKQAIVYFVRQSGVLSAEGFVVRLRCKQGQWSADYRKSLWVS